MTRTCITGITATTQATSEKVVEASLDCREWTRADYVSREVAPISKSEEKTMAVEITELMTEPS